MPGGVGQKRNAKKQQQQSNKIALPKKSWKTGGQRDMTKKKKTINHMKNKETGADKLMKLGGAHGKNALGASHREKNREVLAAKNQDSTCDVTPATTSAAIQSFALGIILAAKRRGLNSSMTASSQWQAYCYLVGVIRSAIEGATLEFTSAPRWFVEILAALRPKNHSALTAEVNYEMIILETEPALSSTMTFGTNTEAYTLCFGEPVGAQVNKFQAIVPAGAYDPEQGKRDFAELWTVFQSTEGTPTELISPTQELAFLKRDCSAYAKVTSRLGAGFFNVGGINNRLENEVYIDCPVLSRFAQDNDTEDEVTGEFRTGFNYANGGGTACYLGPRCLEFEYVSQFKNKARQIFKYYDLLAFYEVLALIIGGVQEKVVKQQAIVFNEYPLSVQQTLLMLRQALIPFFNNEMAQDLRLKNPTGLDSAIEVYLPLTVGDNGNSQTLLESSPLMPCFFTEMVKGATRLTVDVGDGSIPGRQVIDWVPVLSHPAPPTVATNYTFDNNGVATNVFRDVQGETYINPIDCSAIAGNATLYLDLNGLEIAAYVDAHNKWMTAHQPFLTALCKLTATAGNPIFSSIVINQIVTRVDPPAPVVAPNTTATAPKMQKRNSIKSFGAGLSAVKAQQVQPIPGPGTSFNQKAVIRQQSNVPFFSEAQKYVSALVCPVVETRSEGFASGSSNIQSIYGEYIRVPFASTTSDNINVTSLSAPTLYQMHLAAAELDQKNATSSQQTELEKYVQDQDTEGGGGFLSSLSKILQAGGKAAVAIGGVISGM
jgi:hypothetical protein